MHGLSTPGRSTATQDRLHAAQHSQLSPIGSACRMHLGSLAMWAEHHAHTWHLILHCVAEVFMGKSPSEVAEALEGRKIVKACRKGKVRTYFASAHVHPHAHPACMAICVELSAIPVVRAHAEGPPHCRLYKVTQSTSSAQHSWYAVCVAPGCSIYGSSWTGQGRTCCCISVRGVGASEKPCGHGTQIIS